MAPRTKRVIAPAEETGDEMRHDLMTVEDEPQSDEERIADILRDMGQDGVGKIRVTRIAATGKEYCGNLTPSEFEAGELDLIRNTWGAGKYEIMFHGRRDDGTMGLLKRATVTIAEVKGSSLGASNVPAIASVYGAGNGGVSDIVRVMMEGQQRMADAITALSNKPQAPPVDPMAQMAQMFTMMKLMREAMGDNNSKTPIGELLGAFRELKDASNEFGNPTEKRDPMLEMIDTAKPILGVIAERLKEQQAPHTHSALPAVTVPAAFATPVEPRPAPRPLSGDVERAAPTPFTPQETVTDNPQENNVNMAEQMQVAFLIAKIKAFFAAHTQENSTVEAAAELLYEKLPDDVLEVLESEVWYEVLTQTIPGLEGMQVWLTAVRGRVLEFITEDSAQVQLEQDQLNSPST